MAFKLLLICSALCFASGQAGLTHLAPAATVTTTYSAAPAVSYSHFAGPAIAAAPAAYATYSSPAIGSTHQSTIRSYAGTVSHDSKAIDTAFSSVRKSDTRVSNNVYAAGPALATATHYTAAAAPVAYAHAAAPVAYAAPATATVLTHAAPAAVHYSAAPLVAHVSFDGLGTHYAF